MPKTKGTDVVSLKKLLTSKGKEVEQSFLSKLSEDDQKVYQSIIATSWTDVEVQARIYSAAGDTLFPGMPDAIEKLGYMLGEKAYSGVYSIFLQIPKTSYIFKRAANVWKSYHDKGEASVENIQEKSTDLVVRGYPELPKPMRQSAIGHITILLEKTGLKNIKVKLDESNPDQWVWHTTWN